MVTARNLALALFLTLAAPVVGFSQDKDNQGKKPWWNPFASSEQSSSSAQTRDSQFLGGSKKTTMPEFKFPTWSKSSSASKNKPSAMSRMTSTSKKWWDNTVDFMNPFDDKPTSKTNGYQPQKQVKQGKGWFGWMWQEEKVESPSSVNEFLNRPRPGFNDSFTR